MAGNLIKPCLSAGLETELKYFTKNIIKITPVRNKASPFDEVYVDYSVSTRQNHITLKNTDVTSVKARPRFCVSLKTIFLLEHNTCFQVTL